MSAGKATARLVGLKGRHVGQEEGSAEGRIVTSVCAQGWVHHSFSLSSRKMQTALARTHGDSAFRVKLRKGLEKQGIKQNGENTPVLSGPTEVKRVGTHGQSSPFLLKLISFAW